MQNTQDHVCRTMSAAKQAPYIIVAAGTAQKNVALLRTAGFIKRHQTAVFVANVQDVEQTAREGSNDTLLDHLRPTEKTMDATCGGLRQIIAPPDTVGEMDEFRTRGNGLQIGKMCVPLDIVGIIYESRPSVTADTVALCLKSGNTCVLCGGSEAFNSNMALPKPVTQALVEDGLSAAAVSLIENIDRGSISVMLQSPEFIDVVIPRGGKSLVSHIATETRVLVIKYFDGTCHVYTDRAVDAGKVVNTAFNIKTSRYGTCNTMETLLIHQSRATEVLSVSAEKYAARDVELRGCPYILSILPQIQMTSKEDWDIKYFAPTLFIKTVDSLEEAVAHINTHGSHRTDSIVIRSRTDIRTLLHTVGSTSVMVNTSTRFADGSEHDLGVETGISAGKAHVHGPVDLHGLILQEWIVLGDGQV